MRTWRCGDCGTKYPKTVHYCTRYFDDFVSLRGGSVESAITQAVEKAIAPLVQRSERRLAAAGSHRVSLGQGGRRIMTAVDKFRESLAAYDVTGEQIPVTQHVLFAALVELDDRLRNLEGEEL